MSDKNSVAHVTHSERAYSVIDPLQPTKEIVTETAGTLKFAPNDTLIVGNPETAAEIQEKKPWISIREFENRGVRPAVVRTRKMFTMPELPWKAHKEKPDEVSNPSSQ
jgi:hypothetical protein